MNTLDSLNGSIITNFVFIHDYIQILTNKGGINVYNPVFYFSDSIFTKVEFGFPLTKIIGRKINNSIINKDEKVVVFTLDDMSQIEISLLPIDYLGPEAMDIQLLDGRIIII